MKNKKNLIFSASFRPHKGGVAEFVFNIANYLAKNDLLEGVITCTPSEEEQFSYPVCISNLCSRKRESGKRFGDGFVLIRKINAAFYKLALHYYAYKDLQPILKKKSEVKILMGAYFTYDSGVFLNMCRFLGVEYEILFHGLDILLLSRQFGKQFEKNTRGASRLIFNSDATRDMFVERINNDLTPSVVVYPLIDTTTILNTELYAMEELEKKWGIALKGKRIISCVAVLGKRKGVKIAISAMTELVKTHPESILIIGGYGPEKENLEKQIKELGLEDKVFLLGLVLDKEKFSLLKYSEIFVLPSSSLKGDDWEGFGISYIEASLFENVVIGGEHGGIVEAVDDGKSGYLIDFDSADGGEKLCEVMERVIRDGAGGMGAYGRKFVVENFDIENFEGAF